MRSIELTLDDGTDAAVRAEWAALLDAGLPSLATHRGATNRPHVTLAAGEELADTPQLREALAVLPIVVETGGLLLFRAGRGAVVLSRQVVASAALLNLHRAVHAAITGAVELTLPGKWTPHITLARRLAPDRLAPALAVLPESRPVALTGGRLWDGVEKTVVPLS